MNLFPKSLPSVSCGLLPGRGVSPWSVRHAALAITCGLGTLLPGAASGAIYSYVDGQNNASAISVGESSVFAINSGTATQSGSVSVTSMQYGLSKAGGGTLVFSNLLSVGNFLMAEGRVVVSGTGSTMQNLTVGAFSDATAPIFEVSGGSLTLSVYHVGATQAGEMRVTNGGVVYDSDTSTIGSGSQGLLTISGTGSAVITSGYQVTIGGSGTGAVVLRDGGKLSSSTWSRVAVLGNSFSGRGTLNIGAQSGEAAAAPGIVDLNQVIGGLGGGEIVFNHTSTNYYFTNNGTVNGGNMWVHGNLGFRVENGVTNMRDINTNTGDNFVVGGELIISLVDDTYSALGEGDLNVGVSGTLSGVGRVIGDATIAGHLSPGKSIGLMTFDSGLTLESTATLSIEIGGHTRGVQYDAIDVAGLLDLDGTLRISFVNGFIPSEDDAFAIFGGGFTSNGSFANIIMPSGYQGAFNAVTGVLSVAPVPEPSTMLLALLAGGVVCVRRRRGAVRGK